MSTLNLDKLFKPTSIAVIGASNRPGAVGALVMQNLLQGGFDGPIMPVNPRRQSVSGVLTYPSIGELPITPDAAIICTPPHTVPGLIKELGERGTKAAIVLTAGLSRELGEDGTNLQDAMAANAKADDLRILGPNCLGLLVPGIGLNASFSHLPALPGKIAFISQSGALCTAVLDWARTNDIGFSHFISMGDTVDVDFGAVIDYLGSDPYTRAILLYIESIKERRNFMSAARAAARNKPVLVIKSGRVAEGAQAAASHTGALAGSDDVYDAAINRAGMLRVDSIDELFAASETLSRSRPLSGERLAIMTNGGGVGVLAVDTLIKGGGTLATLEPETINKLGANLPDTWSKSNPVDIIGDAPGERYAHALEVLCQAKEVDAILAMHCPTATASSSEAAQAIIDTTAKNKANVLTAWVGGEVVAESRRMFHAAGIATFATPEAAVQAFMHMVQYRRNQDLLTQAPPSAPTEFTPDTDYVKKMLASVLADGRDMMSEAEAKSVLAAYGIPTVRTEIVTTPDEAAMKADEIGYPVALKILSRDISHKSDAGGVRLFLESAEAVKAEAEAMLNKIGAAFPDANLEGFTVQQMAVMPNAHELIIGSSDDNIFGPTMLFGHGGTAVEVINDTAIALPPLNMGLAAELISRTRISKLLKGYRDRPAVNMDAVKMTLMQVSQLIVDFPAIAELDINPLFADENGVLAVDARIRVKERPANEETRLAIRPYPKQLEEDFNLGDGRPTLLRPIRPEDEPEHYEFISKLTPEDIRFRFFGTVRQLPHSEMARLTQINYEREMAFIASALKEDGSRETLGVVRTNTDPNNERAEFAIVVRSDLHELGLGSKLLDKMIDYCKDRKTNWMVGQVLEDNRLMLQLAESKGFSRKRVMNEGVFEVTLKL
ncbi:MAG: GNAT family N-acetyltransferase [Rhodospirillales bacterium]|jgi:acetyltransferase|nr:GNAT family N-acetyltransferase [Rhodospirillales bacterium]